MHLPRRPEAKPRRAITRPLHLALVPLLVLAACDSDTGATTVTVSAEISDFLSGAPIAAATVRVETAGRAATTSTTDAEGAVSFRVPPGADFVATVTGDTLREHVLYDRADGTDTTLTYALATETTIAAFETLLGVTVDDEDAGMFDVLVREKGSRAMIPGVTVTLDAASDLALVLDAASPTGVSAGNVTQPDSESTVIFVNVVAGAVTPTLSHPDGWVCDVGPATVDLAPGTYVFAYYQCERP